MKNVKVVFDAHFFLPGAIRDRIIRSISIWFCWYFPRSTKQRYWQICRYTTSYERFSIPIFLSFTNTHLLIDLLLDWGLLTEADLKGVDFGQDPTMDYAKVFEQRRPLLENAVAELLEIRCDQKELSLLRSQFSWLSSSQNTWLLAHFDFESLTDGGSRCAYSVREPKSFAKCREYWSIDFSYHRVTQFFFFNTLALKAYANDHIEIVEICQSM